MRGGGVWFLSVNVDLNFILVFMCVNSSFLFTSEYFAYVSGPVRSSQFVTITNKASMKSCVLDLYANILSLLVGKYLGSNETVS